MATAGVILFKGPQARRYTRNAVHTQGGAYTMRNARKAVCGHRSSHFMKGAIGKAVRAEGGAHTKRNTEKAVCGQRRSHVI